MASLLSMSCCITSCALVSSTSAFVAVSTPTPCTIDDKSFDDHRESSARVIFGPRRYLRQPVVQLLPPPALRRCPLLSVYRARPVGPARPPTGGRSAPGDPRLNPRPVLLGNAGAHIRDAAARIGGSWPGDDSRRGLSRVSTGVNAGLRASRSNVKGRTAQAGHTTTRPSTWRANAPPTALRRRPLSRSN